MFGTFRTYKDVSPRKIYRLHTPDYIDNIRSGWTPPAVFLPSFKVYPESYEIYLSDFGAAFAQSRGFILEEIIEKKEK